MSKVWQGKRLSVSKVDLQHADEKIMNQRLLNEYYSCCPECGERAMERMNVKDTGFKTLKRTSAFNFLKWGEYMKRAQVAEAKVEKLLSLLLLTDPCVSNVAMNEVTQRQWTEFVNWSKYCLGVEP